MKPLDDPLIPPAGGRGPWRHTNARHDVVPVTA